MLVVMTNTPPAAPPTNSVTIQDTPGIRAVLDATLAGCQKVIEGKGSPNENLRSARNMRLRYIDGRYVFESYGIDTPLDVATDEAGQVTIRITIGERTDVGEEAFRIINIVHFLLHQGKRIGARNGDFVGRTKVEYLEAAGTLGSIGGMVSVYLASFLDMGSSDL